MFLRSLLILTSLTMLVGCATTRSSSSGLASQDQMQTRITQLEEELSRKDGEISDLKEQMQSLSEDVQQEGDSARYSSSGRNRYAEDDAETNYTYRSSSRTSRDGIIRVEASVDQVQLALKNAGYYAGPVDGKVGDKTRRAIADFQTAHNLKADGVVGRKTWSVLKSYQNR